MNIQYKQIICQMGVGLALIAGSLAAQAGPITEGSFVAEAVEDYEGTPGDRALLTSIFGGDVSVIAGTVTHISVDEGDWRDFRGGSDPIVPVSGTRFGTANGDGTFSLDFTGLGGIFGFSGWFSGAGVGVETIEFFGAGQESLDIVSRASGFGPGNGTMEFLSVVSTVAIQSLTISGQEIALDDLAYATSLEVVVNPVPVPGTLLLFGLGLAGLGLAGKRARSQRSLG